MTIECHYSRCPHHGVHTDPDDGPFCYQRECLQPDSVLEAFADQRAVAAALSDMVDGQSAEDIRRFTGMPLLRCEHILAVAQGST